MLKNYNILIIGGDERYIEVISHLTNKNAHVTLVGLDQLTINPNQARKFKINDVAFHKIDAILLPVAGTGPNGEISANDSEQLIYLKEEMIKQTPKHCMIYTGITNPFLDSLAISTKRNIYSLFARDDLAILNSIPTAEGALQLAMEQTNETIHNTKTLIFGFGRVGMTVARLFSSVGAHVYVYARHSAYSARIFEMGLTPINQDNITQDLLNMDIMINTIPAQVIDKKILSSTKQSTLIIDLASAPGGVDFDYAASRDIKTIHALGLPGKTAPKTAGKIIAQTLQQALLENNSF